MMHPVHRWWFAGLCALAGVSALDAAEPAASPAVESSVVKVFASQRAPDLMKPWTKQAVADVSGSGVMIDGNRILTNAHVVSYASQVQVQANQAGDKVNATVVAFAPAVDLALLKVDDEAFFKDHRAVPRESTLPKPKDEVLAYGYPTGGSSLSITKGIVSRVEFAPYNINGAGLRVQIDAAINPGNSGGPVLTDGKLVGIAYAVLNGTQNISYIIPTEEIELFLRDVSDGRYDGKPALYDDLQTLENPALRQSLGLAAGVTGMVVRTPFTGAGTTPLKEWDVITRIGNTAIDDQGMVTVDGQRVLFQYLVQKLASGGHVSLTVIRAGKPLTLEVPVVTQRPMMVPDLRGTYPPYFIYGPLVFTRASLQLIAALGQRMAFLTASGNPLLPRMTDVPTAAQSEFVVVSSPLFSHRSSAGYSSPAGSVVESVNGVHIRSLAHLVAVLRDLKEEFVTVRFAQRSGEHLVFRRQEMTEATESILNDNGIRAQGSSELMDIWNAKGH
jgi:S1-C subfamily serine protease